MIENIGAYSQVDYERGYEKGRADERTDILNTIKNDLCDRLVEEQNNPYQDQSLCEGLYLAIKRCDWYLSNDKENKNE